MARRKKTSIDVDEALWRRVKMYAAASNKKVSDVVEEALRKYLRDHGWPEER